MNKKIVIFLLSCVLVLACCMGMAAGASDNAEAKLVAHNLTITEAGINVNFYVDIQGEVEVTLNGNKVDDFGEKQQVIVDAKAYNCYKFTQPVVAKEMNDEVSLVIKSGDTPLVDESYSVNNYVAKVQNAGYNYDFESLANAMTYYGEFADVYLKYSGKTEADEDATASINAVDESAFASYKMSVDKAAMPEGLTYRGIKLNLNSEITLRLVFAVEGDVDTEKLKAEGVSYNLKNAKNECYIDIEKIGADKLDKAYTIKYDDQTIISNCSVLSYAKAVVDKYAENPEKANLVNLSKALYLYNQKAVTYVTSQTTAVYDIFYNGTGFYADPEGDEEVYLTSNGDVTRSDTGNQVISLNQLKDSRTKGCSVWMETAYEVSGTEEISGPYVIRRYAENTGSVLNVAGTATFTAIVDGSKGEFAAKYPSGSTVFTISEEVNNEVAVSGTVNVTDGAKTGVITVADGNTATINAAGLTKNGKVVLASYKGVTLTGNGEISAIELVDDGDDHYGVVKQSDNLRIASVICVCGVDVTGKDSHSCPWTNNVDDIADVYDIPWQAYTATSGTLPGIKSTEAKYYYLANNLTLERSDIAAVGTYLDLNGKTITANSSWNIRIQEGANYSITDSKNEGTITTPQTLYYTYGALIVYDAAGTFTVYGGTIDMTKSEEVLAPIDVNRGALIMHGGVIKGAKTTKPYNNTTYTNCIETRNGGKVTVTGGAIYGEVLLRNKSDVLKATGDAQVGASMEGITSNGIRSWEVGETANVIVSNLTDRANIVLQSRSSIKLAENDNSNSVLTGIKAEDGHFGVIKENGSLQFKSVICVCGDDVTGKESHSCAWTDSIEQVYNIPWQAYTATEGLMPGYNVSGYYYLANDLKLSGNSQITVDSYLDLNGNTITAAYDRSIQMNAKDADYSIADSKGTGKIELPDDYQSTCTANAGQGAVLFVYYSYSKFIMYGGTIDLSNAAADTYTNTLIHVEGDSGADFIMHGGEIKPAQNGDCIYIEAKGRVTVNGGKISGKISLYDNDTNHNPTLTIGNDAEVGLPLDGISDYGIRAENTGVASLVCNNLKEEAKVVIKTKENLALSEKENSNSVLTGIKAEDGHFGVIKENGSLQFKSVICVCGDDVTGKESHSCVWADSIEQVYNIPWQAYTATSGTLPGISSTEAKYYYLANNLTLQTSNITAVGTYLDLNGKTITANSSWNIRIQEGANYSITDSKNEGTITTPQTLLYGYGALIVYDAAGTFTVYGGTIDMTKSEEVLAPIDVNRGALIMHGGVIKGAKTTKPYENKTYTNCIETRNGGKVTVTGGAIYGEVLLRNKSDVLEVGGDAQVGVSTQEINSNGIKAWEVGETANVIASNLTDEAKIVFKGSGSIKLSDGYEIVNVQDELLLQKKAEQ